MIFSSVLMMTKSPFSLYLTYLQLLSLTTQFFLPHSSTLGICDLDLAWFRSYLSDRRQTACVNGIYFEPSAPMHGVPKGSVLGPILFLLYATPVSDIINYHLRHHEGFADDTQLHTSPHITELD